MQAAEIQVGIGDGQAPALAVAHRARIGAGALRTHLQRAARVNPCQRAAARPYRMDVEHGYLHRAAGHDGFGRRARLLLA